MKYCTYCGAQAQCRDHTIPVACKSARHFDTVDLTPACNDCNQILGSKLFDTISDRAAYVLGILTMRLKKMPPCKWDAEELEELDYGLRTHILAARAEREFTLARIAFLTGEDE